MKEEVAKYSLPKGWAQTTINDLVGGHDSFIKDGDWIESKDQNPNGEIRLIQLADIGVGEFRDKSNRFMKLSRAEELNCTFLQKGDILVARMPDPLGRACIFPYDGENKYVTVVDVAIIRTSSNGVSNNFLMHFINTPQFREKIEALQSGSTRKRISRGNLSSIIFPLPPLKEQARISAKLEEIFSELDHSVKNLNFASAQLKVFRQVILQQAFEGRLTEYWRRDNKLEPANKLLKQIIKEVQVWYQQELEDWKKELLEWEKRGKDGVRPTKPKAKKDPYIISGEDLPILPDGWDWTTLESFTAITGGVTKGKRYGNIDTIELPYLSVANVQDGYFDLSQIKKIRIAHNELKKYQLKYGDILYTEGGDKDKLGRGAIWRGEINNCIHQNHVFRARVLSNEVNPVFCALFSQTKVAKDYFYRNAKQTTNLASINLTVLSRLPFPLPSRAEQDLIVEMIESRFSLTENLENALNAGLRECQSLKQSILKMAFQGNLVPQDSSDIPANALLDKIAIERKEFLIAEKQRRVSFKSSDKSRVKMAKQLKEIIDLLKENSEAIRTKDLWEDSIYQNDIDSFYAALKKHLEEGVIIELPRQGRESYIKLADKK